MPRAAVTAPEKSAKIAGLNYISDRSPGFRRVGTGKTFRYLGSSGRPLHDPQVLKRIKRLAIPPAWSRVWISPDPDSHLQAVGRDARERKQYRYHPLWREVRDTTKYHRMYAFGKVLPRIRARVARDLKNDGLGREKVLATIVSLLETTSIRVGNEEYSKQNNSFGLTTLRNRHVEIKGEKIIFFFRGKSGIRHRIGVEDKHLAKIVRRLRDLPGYELFQFIDHDGSRRSISSTDVNDYLREIAGDDFTAKDFRTWTGTVLAAATLCGLKPFASAAQAKKNVVTAVGTVAGQLGNTVAVCRKSYIHPAVFDAYLDGTLANDLKAMPRTRGLSSQESAVLRFLRKVSKSTRKPTLEEALAKSISKVSKIATRQSA